MNVIHLPRQRQRSYPVLCFIDLQLEYVSDGRALAMDETDPWLGNCRRLLSFAREQRLPIAHFRQLRRGAFLNPATSFSGWIEEFRPRPSEMVFERSMPSCYSAPGFPAMTDNIDDPLIVLSGLTSSGACLATVLDSFHRNHTSCFISDASWSQPLGCASSSEANAFSGEIIRQYSDVMSTDELIEWLSKEKFSLVS
jgi:nicotinamidase-related amidase